MATTKAVVTQQYLTDIADAIRAKGGATALMKPSEMASAIEAIPSGGGGGRKFTLTIGQVGRDSSGEGVFLLKTSDGSIFNADTGSYGNWDQSNATVFTDIVAIRVDDILCDGNADLKINGVRKSLGVFHDIADGDVVYVERYSECLFKGTMITLADGSQRPIELITYDDDLMVWDFDKGCKSSARPIWIKKPEKVGYYFRNVLSDGRVLLTTGKSKTGWGHRMFDVTRNSFVYTTQSVSDVIATEDGVARHVSCERVDCPCESYNVITAGHFNLYANGVLTSCSLNNGISDIESMKYVRPETRHTLDEFASLPDEYVSGFRLLEQRTDAGSLIEYVHKLMRKKV